MLKNMYWTTRSAFLRVLRVGKAISTEARRRAGVNHVSRWSSVDNLDPMWNERTRLLAQWIPDGSRVLEFGAGRQVMRDYLPPGCSYTPSDIVPRTAATLVFDLNKRPLDGLAEYDVAVFSGVFEYVRDLDGALDHLAPSFSTIVASYASTDVAENAAAVWRRSRGWVNDLAAREFEALFHRHGFRTVARREWLTQSLFHFESVSRPAATQNGRAVSE